jgi:hypothetical protein
MRTLHANCLALLIVLAASRIVYTMEPLVLEVGSPVGIGGTGIDTIGVTYRGQDEDDEDEPLVTDRPDFTEASSTVGRGVVQLESGYTFSYNDSEIDAALTRSHTGPEALWRIGITDEVELRIVWTYLWERTIEGGGAAANAAGSDDLMLGSKIEVSRACGLLPESAVILQGTVPTGARQFSNRKVTVGVNYLYSWELENGWGLGASTGFDTAVDRNVVVLPQMMTVESFDDHIVFHQSIALGIPLSDSLGMYLEYFGLYFHARDSNVPQNFVDGGFTYLVNNDVQLDWRVGKGLNDNADDFFTGAGLSVRF